VPFTSKMNALAILSLIAASIVVPGVAQASPADVPVSSLTKSAQDVTNPGATTIGHGDTVNWVISYADTGVTGSATLTDPINGAPGNQSYVPGSLQLPPGWTPSWSTDGSTFTGTEPPTGTVAVRGVNDAVHPGGTNLTRQLLPPVKTTATSTGGDGFTPILYRSASGAVQVWNTYHHLYEAAPKVVCSDLLTGAPCAGGPWPRPLNTTPGPLGSGATGDIMTTLTPQYVFDPGHPGQVFYPAVTTTTVGVACLDMDAQANCGYYPLENTGGSPSSVNSLGGVVATGGNLYGVDTKGQVLCMTIASRTPCAGQPYAAIVAPTQNTPGCTTCLYYGAMTVADGRVYASSSMGGLPTTMGCFDPATQTNCTGWTSPIAALGSSGSFSYDIFDSYDRTGTVNGVCTTLVSSPTTTDCVTLAGFPLAAPTGASVLPAGAYTFNPETITAPDGDLQSYFGSWNGGLAGGTTCWDWNTGAPCANFPALLTHPGVNGGATRDYGYDYDTTTQCLLGLGDAGYLFSEDPTTGTSPCIHSGASVSLDTAGFYCDGATGHVHGYQDAKLENINLADVDLAHSSVTVTDVDGTVITTTGFASDGTVDLSGIDIAAHPHIVVTDQLDLLNTSDFTGTNHPDLVATFHGDPPQMCFHTTPTAACTVTSVTNTANGADPSGTFASNTVDLPIAPGAACSPLISVNKEICGDVRASHCGPGGDGPWLKTTPVGLLGLLGTARWRITVTNSGSVDAVGATINDSVTPSCRSNAGTFSVPAGATVQFYCSSLILALPLTNTASVTFSAAGDPAGTPPTTSASSSATACSLLCDLTATDTATKH
jgi:hypothetical protein